MKKIFFLSGLPKDAGKSVKRLLLSGMMLIVVLIISFFAFGDAEPSDDSTEQMPPYITPGQSIPSSLLDFMIVDGISEIPLAFVRLGDPIPGLTPEQLAAFQTGRQQFMTVENVTDGIGPIFNGRSCVECHDLGAVGGGSNVRFETRFGLRLANGTFDPLTNLGGSLLQVFSIGSEDTPPGCFFPTERIPFQANTVTKRRAIPLFGSGLLDSVPAETIVNIAALERAMSPGTAGRVSIADNIAQGVPTVSRFGWKAQIPVLFQFSGNAYVNEMGITNPQFPLENCPNAPPDCDLVRRCNPVPGLNDDGADVQAFFDFMRFLAPPPRGMITMEVIAGEKVFKKIGCASCHLPTLVSGASDAQALSNKVFHPYSDLLLHDMGSLGDGIGGSQGNASLVEGNARTREMRTQPLWGLRFETKLLHDLRANSPREAILAHDGQGRASRDAFLRSSLIDQANLIRFLNSL